MTRIGINPARGKQSDYRPARITLAVVTYIPSLEGYFENRLEVLKLCLASLQAHTAPPHDLFIFDNGSCNPVTEYLVSLRNVGRVDCLLLSQRNLGKIDALKVLFSAAPGELIAYNDDDILFYPGWLEAHLEVMESFPKVGMVSGIPVRNAAGHAFQSLEQLASQASPDIQVLRERRIPDDWEADWAMSTGRDLQSHLQATREQVDLVLRAEHGGRVEAIGGANHFQFVAPKEIILQALPDEWTGKLMGSMIELDQAVDRLGYLRLSTVQRFTRHLGNNLSDEVRRETASLGLIAPEGRPVPSKRMNSRQKHWVLRLPGSRRALSALYKRLFDILYK